DFYAEDRIKQEPPELKDEPFHDFPDINQEEPISDIALFGTSSEIKEEPKEIKDEPVDELDDLVQEEPIADIFCPSTGSSRPLDQSTSTIDNSSKSKGQLRRCVVCQKSRHVRDMHVFTNHKDRRSRWVNAVRSTIEGRESLMEILNGRAWSYLCASHFSPSDCVHYGKFTKLRTDAVPFIKKEESENEEEPIIKKSRPESIQKTTRMQRRNCVVCDLNRNENEMHVFTTDKDRRSLWVDAVRSTSEERRELMELLNTKKKSYLCAIHFTPSDYIHTGNWKRLGINAIPTFQFQKYVPETPTTPQCADSSCQKYPSTADAYLRHLESHQKTTLRTNGIFLVCSCGFKIISRENYKNHDKKCEGLDYTVHKLDEN
ncbi:hypothetical protein PMAYCL1PPCAC_13778, partial [Pristionchus mayeri]